MLPHTQGFRYAFIDGKALYDSPTASSSCCDGLKYQIINCQLKLNDVNTFKLLVPVVLVGITSLVGSVDYIYVPFIPPKHRRQRRLSIGHICIIRKHDTGSRKSRDEPVVERDLGRPEVHEHERCDAVELSRVGKELVVVGCDEVEVAVYLALKEGSISI